jgi:predicted small secreted protein
MKKTRWLVACIFLALTAFGFVGCLTARGRGLHPEEKPEQHQPMKKLPPPHK